MVHRILRALLLEPLQLVIDNIPFVRLLLLPKHDHFAPHPGAPFEGYYTRILTTTGNTILLIFSSVPAAKDHTHYVHFSHILPPSRDRDHQEPDILIDRFPTMDDVMSPPDHDGVQAFKKIATSDGFSGVYDITRHEQNYRLDVDDDPHYGKVEVIVRVSQRRPWVGGETLSTPEGIFSRLVFLLPLHWNVLSTASRAEFTIKRNGEILERGTGVAHVEKNWGTSFPPGWTWWVFFLACQELFDTLGLTFQCVMYDITRRIQGFSSATTEEAEPTTFALAGGKILGQRAYLLGYRSPTLKWSFRPLFTLLPFGFATPFISETMDSKAGTAHIDVSSLRRRLVIDAQAPADHEGWIGLHCPLSDGHANTFAFESFEGVIRIKAYARTWWGGWEFLEESVLDKAAVEFGGDYSFKASLEL